MGFLGALLGAAPIVGAGIAKGKRQLEQTQYERASKAQDDAMKEAARQQAMQQAIMEYQGRLEEAKAQHAQTAAYQQGTLKNQLDIAKLRAEQGTKTQHIIEDASGQHLVGPDGEIIANYGKKPREPQMVIMPGQNPDGTPGIFRIPKAGPAGAVEGVAPAPKAGEVDLSPVIDEASRQAAQAVANRKGKWLTDTEVRLAERALNGAHSTTQAIASLAAMSGLDPDARAMAMASITGAEAKYKGKRVANEIVMRDALMNMYNQGLFNASMKHKGSEAETHAGPPALPSVDFGGGGGHAPNATDHDLETARSAFRRAKTPAQQQAVSARYTQLTGKPFQP